MRRLTDQQVDRIARDLAARMGTGTSSAANNPGGTMDGPPGGASPVAVALPRGGGSGEGVYDTVDGCVAAARIAFDSLGEASLSKRGEIIAAIRDTMRVNGDELARLAWEETGLGRYEDKIIKNRLVTEKTPGTEALTPVATTGDDGLTLMEWAPFGVIGAITPTTNPTSTIICNTIGMVAAGNSVVFNVHPGRGAVFDGHGPA